MIEVKNLTKRFGATVAVKDVSFSVPTGQVLGFLGPNGAGKTTTMRIITGYMPADEGTADVAGYNIKTDSLEVRKRLGYLPENAPLYLDMDVPDFLKFIATIRKIKPSEHSQAIGRIVDLCGLQSVQHKRIGELSKGYRQRVGLAQAMIHNPEILVLDEPTSGLDPNQIIEIRELIKKIGKEKTVILSTHILQEVTATCDRILIINEGRLVADGTPDSLTKQATGETTLLVTVKAPPDKVKAVFSKIPGVTQVRESGSTQDRVRAELRFLSDTNPEEQVFRTVVENQWILTEMRRESASLEDVFARLTT
jgi:ABC-2 type transport system ATP-binding protein